MAGHGLRLVTEVCRENIFGGAGEVARLVNLKEILPLSTTWERVGEGRGRERLVSHKQEGSEVKPAVRCHT